MPDSHLLFTWLLESEKGYVPFRIIKYLKCWLELYLFYRILSYLSDFSPRSLWLNDARDLQILINIHLCNSLLPDGPSHYLNQCWLVVSLTQKQIAVKFESKYNNLHHKCCLKNNSHFVHAWISSLVNLRNHSVYAPSHWETALHCNVISHWLRPYSEWFLKSSICKFHTFHDDIIKWKHFLRYWPFVRGIHPSSVNSRPHKGQWHRALMFSWICDQINGWVNNRKAGDLGHHCAHYDVNVMYSIQLSQLY